VIFPGCASADAGLRVRAFPVELSGEMPEVNEKASSAVDSRWLAWSRQPAGEKQ
jgi:hypothetical protein